MITKRKLFWLKDSTPVELHAMLGALAEEYPIRSGTGRGGVQVQFVKSPTKGRSAVQINGALATIEYYQVSMAARGLGALLAGVETQETTVFRSLGIMLDCSRNAVMTVDHFKRWLRRLALMGYNQASLYLEDTYRLPGEPYFGYMRGAYTEAELLQINAYAGALGIEMMASIQTLGHLQQLLRWAPYAAIRDTSSVLLVDCDATYQLIEKMVAFWSRVFGSRNISIGMDETHDLGRGRFMDRFGYERGFDIFNRHLERVSAICRKYGLRPRIASDMYFRMGNPERDYYGAATQIPPDVQARIPADVDLVYWDYYHHHQNFYAAWIRRHRALGHEPIMWSGVWTWNSLWYDHQLTCETIQPCIAACTQENVQEITFSLWGDDGAFCDLDSGLAGLCLAAELSFGGGSEALVSRKFQVICAGNYHNHVALSTLQYPCGLQHGHIEKHMRKWDDPLFGVQKISGHLLLWDDPLLGINWNNNSTIEPRWVDLTRANYIQMLQVLEDPSHDYQNASVPHGKLLAEVILLKLDLRESLLKAYAARDMDALESIRKVMIPAMEKALQALLRSFRLQWMKRNKPFGWEVLQLRINGLRGRYAELALRIQELQRGSIASIAELDEPAPQEHGGGSGLSTYQFFASGSVVI